MTKEEFDGRKSTLDELFELRCASHREDFDKAMANEKAQYESSIRRLEMESGMTADVPKSTKSIDKVMALRIFVSVLWGGFMLAVIILVCITWNDMGCGVGSLIMASVFYCTIMFALWYTMDSSIKEANK